MEQLWSIVVTVTTIAPACNRLARHSGTFLKVGQDGNPPVEFRGEGLVGCMGSSAFPPRN